ncbi:MAG: hypothetical protein KGI54_13595 [Pseudomonadota bacterium]|nr:hypothetical protein [Pseudomonadota bacterium]
MQVLVLSLIFVIVVLQMLQMIFHPLKEILMGSQRRRTRLNRLRKAKEAFGQTTQTASTSSVPSNETPKMADNHPKSSIGSVTCKVCGAHFANRQAFVEGSCDYKVCNDQRAAQRLALKIVGIPVVAEKKSSYVENCYMSISPVRSKGDPEVDHYYRDVPQAIMEHCM